MKLLFVVNEPGEFVELCRVALAAKEKGNIVTFYFVQPGYVNLRSDIFFCNQNGFKSYYHAQPLGSRDSEEAWRAKEIYSKNGYIPHSLIEEQADRLPDTIKKIYFFLSVIVITLLTIFRQIILFFSALLRFILKFTPYSRAKNFVDLRNNSTFRYAKNLYQSIRPDVLIFGQEFPGSVNSLMTQIAEKDKVKSIIVPFAVGTTKEMVESLYDKVIYEVQYSLINRLAASIYPKWVNYYKGKALLRLSGLKIFALEGAGLAPKHPWIPNSSNVAKIAVESKRMMDYYKEYDFPADQLELTGASFDDVISRLGRKRKEVRDNLNWRLNLNAKKKILVCAWPTDQFSSRRVPLEFVGYEQLCQAWAKSLQRVQNLSNFQILIKPHPVSDPYAIKSILEEFELDQAVVNEDTAELVAVSHVFVACVSSTLNWAISLGVPAINYDCYNYGYTDFNSGQGTQTVFDHASFEHALLDLVLNKDSLRKVAASQKKVSSDWHMGDGRSTERIIEVIGRMTKDR